MLPGSVGQNALMWQVFRYLYLGEQTRSPRESKGTRASERGLAPALKLGRSVLHGAASLLASLALRAGL